MPATTVRPGRCIKAQLIANGPMATTDLHFAYKEEIRVLRQRKVDGISQRGMHSASFRSVIYFAKRLGYLEEASLEDALGLRGENMTMIRDGEVVPSQRILYRLTPAGQGAEIEWDDLRKAFVNARAGVSQETPVEEEEEVEEVERGSREALALLDFPYWVHRIDSAGLPFSDHQAENFAEAWALMQDDIADSLAGRDDFAEISIFRGMQDPNGLPGDSLPAYDLDPVSVWRRDDSVAPIVIKQVDFPERFTKNQVQKFLRALEELEPHIEDIDDPEDYPQGVIDELERLASVVRGWLADLENMMGDAEDAGNDSRAETLGERHDQLEEFADELDNLDIKEAQEKLQEVE